MNEEQLQFAISQYVDGTLPPDQVSQIQTILKTDPEARRTFEQYRRLNEVLLETLPAPEMDWDALSRRISHAIDQEADRALAPMPIFSRPLWRPLAIAASIGLAATAVLIWASQRQGGGDAPVARNEAVAEIAVNVSRSTPSAAPVAVVAIERNVPKGQPVADVVVSRAPVPWFPQAMEKYREVTATPTPRVLIAALPAPVEVAVDDDLPAFY